MWIKEKQKQTNTQKETHQFSLQMLPLCILNVYEKSIESRKKRKSAVKYENIDQGSP